MDSLYDGENFRVFSYPTKTKEFLKPSGFNARNKSLTNKVKIF